MRVHRVTMVLEITPRISPSEIMGHKGRFRGSRYKRHTRSLNITTRRHDATRRTGHPVYARRTVIVTVARNTLRFGVRIIAESHRTSAIFAWKMALRYFQPRRSSAADDESRLGLGTTRSSTTLDFFSKDGESRAARTDFPLIRL